MGVAEEVSDEEIIGIFVVIHGAGIHRKFWIILTKNLGILGLDSRAIVKYIII